MDIFNIVIQNVISLIFKYFKREDFERTQMRIKRKLKIGNLSLSAGELIVAILENSGAALKTMDGICVTINEQKKLFESRIPQNERVSDENMIEELCDRGLICAYDDNFYFATDKAKNNVEKLRKLDEICVYIYAPDLVKFFFPVMANEDFYLFIPHWNALNATIAMKNDKNFRTKYANRRDVEKAVEYLYRERLIENLRLVDENFESSGSLTIKDKLNLQTISLFFKDASRIRIVADVSKRGRSVAKIDLKNFNELVKNSH